MESSLDYSDIVLTLALGCHVEPAAQQQRNITRNDPKPPDDIPAKVRAA